ncbi:MAG: uracil-DNA glycosylase [Pseudomonadota bacterium]
MADADTLSIAELDALLRFHVDAGADEVLADAPVDRFAAPAQKVSAIPRATQPAQSQARAQTPPVAQKPVVIPDGSVIDEARRIAQATGDLDALKSAIASFDGCNLKNTARNLAFEGGTRGAHIMLVGGAASRDDDATGVPFSGLDGILLKNMLSAIGIDAGTQTYHGLCVPWAPPGGGPPTPLHLNIMRSFLERQIELAKPDVLIVMGNVAARHLLDQKQTVLKLRGQWFDATIGGWNGATTVMHEPSYLREQPAAKRATWLDLLALKNRLTQG